MTFFLLIAAIDGMGNILTVDSVINSVSIVGALGVEWKNLLHRHILWPRHKVYITNQKEMSSTDKSSTENTNTSNASGNTVIIH